MEDLMRLARQMTYPEKVRRSREIIRSAITRHGAGVVVAHSLGKDSSAVWHLVQSVARKMEFTAFVRGFIVTTVHKFAATKRFMAEEVARWPSRLVIYQAEEGTPTDIYHTDPDTCCDLLKVEPTKRALRDLSARAWVTGLRCTEGRTRTDYQEVEDRGDGLEKINPILLWTEREIWQYLALNYVPVNPAYAGGYRSLGCEPCSGRTSDAGSERDGRWQGTSKCGGECGIHTKPMR